MPLLAGTFAASVHHGLTSPAGAATLIKGGWLGTVVNTYPSEMAQNFWTAIIAWSTCFFVTIIISLLTKRTKTDEDLKGLVYSLTARTKDDSKHWYQKPLYLAIIVGIVTIILNIIFW
jgi:SSS family solute:Na+ symporter